MDSIWDIQVMDMQGQPVRLADYRGKVLLIVNTATGCGFTPQYEGLQTLYDTYRGRGFEVLDFPCNQFGNQAPGDIGAINDFCALNYHTTFPRFAKIEVNGAGESPLYTYLKKQKGGLLGGHIKWNFTKFLVDQKGQVVRRYAPATKPEDIAGDIEKLLAQPV